MGELMRYTCSDFGCVDVGVGIIHHPYCGMTEEQAENCEPPFSPEEEEVILSEHPDAPAS